MGLDEATVGGKAAGNVPQPNPVAPNLLNYFVSRCKTAEL